MNQNIKICRNCGYDKNELIFIKYGYELVKCKKCDLVFLNNPPSKEELKKLYSFNEGWHNVFSDEKSLESIYHSKLSKQYYNIVKKRITTGKILDVGCSVGFFLNYAKKDGWDVVGTEMNNDTAEIGRNRYNLKIESKPIEELDLNDETFDVISLWDVLEHLEDPLDVSMKMNKLIKMGGYLYISTPNIDGLFPKVSYIVANLINYWSHPGPPYHLFQFSVKTLNSILSKAGFEVKDVYHENIQIKHSFGKLSEVLKSLKKIVYSLIFIPFALTGPLFKMGDTIIVSAKKVKNI